MPAFDNSRELAPTARAGLEVTDFLRPLAPTVLAFLALILAALVIGSLIRAVMLRRMAAADRQRHLGSLASWWVLYGLLVAAVVFGSLGGVVLVALLSVLGLHEYLALIPRPDSRWRVRRWAYAAIGFNALWIFLGWYQLFLLFVPVVVFLWLPIRMLLTGSTRGFVRDVSDLHWGLMLIVFCLSHAAWFLVHPVMSENPAGPAGWFLFLLVLTELNDISQALWGRAVGRHRILPTVSPGKTWEGFLGGVLTTTVVAVLVAPLLTSLAPAWSSSQPWTLAIDWRAAAGGLLISVSGFFGDVTMSAVKRDMAVKDAGQLIPGQGGILDRVDSLTFTAPLFFYYVLGLRHLGWLA